VTSEPTQSAEDHYYAGIDFFGEGKLPEAIAEYTRALELDPKFSDALHGLAQAYHAQQDFDRTIETARRILALDPDHLSRLSTQRHGSGSRRSREQSANPWLEATIEGTKSERRKSLVFEPAITKYFSGAGIRCNHSAHPLHRFCHQFLVALSRAAIRQRKRIF
jgi:tetratricopeptide (TPR) repeat protein